MREITFLHDKVGPGFPVDVDGSRAVTLTAVGSGIVLRVSDDLANRSDCGSNSVVNAGHKYYRADCVEYFGTPVPATIAVGGA